MTLAHNPPFSSGIHSELDNTMRIFILVIFMTLSPLISADWLTDCRQKGFDPHQLACGTCSLLPDSFRATCLECCQSYKDIIHRTKPYESAVLILPESNPNLDSEVSQFLESDWADLIKSKGSTRLHQKKDAVMDSGSNNQLARMYGLMIAANAELLLFEQDKVDTADTYEKLKDLAKESISLRGLKRDDIKDMVNTLLR